MKHGWEILCIAASCIGSEARRQSLFTPQPTRQSSTQLPPQARTGRLRPHSKRWRHRSFGGRQLSNYLDHGFRGSTSYPKSLWLKRTSIEARGNQSMRQTRMTTLFALQTYLPPLLRGTHPTSPSNEGPSPSIRIHQRPRRRTPPFFAADDQADALALPFGSPYLRKAEAACPQWQNSQEIGSAQSPQVRRMSLQRDDQDSLARQRV